jgi:hypothetical protein
MIIQKSNLVIITIHKGSIHKLKKTLRSIDSQLCQPHYNIVIAKNIPLYQISAFRKNNRIFILNKDKSIYNAMNIGLRSKLINNKFIIFINSGDIIANQRIIYDLKKYFILHTPIIGRQILQYGETYYHIKENFAKNKNYMPHGSFFCPPMPKNYLSNFNLFNEKRIIDADGIWMQNIIRIFKQKIKKIDNVISILELGGISTLPTKNSVLHYAKINFTLFLKEFIKFVLNLIASHNLYYKIIYFRKYKIIDNNRKKT